MRCEAQPHHKNAEVQQRLVSHVCPRRWNQLWHNAQGRQPPTRPTQKLQKLLRLLPRLFLMLLPRLPLMLLPGLRLLMMPPNRMKKNQHDEHPAGEHLQESCKDDHE